MLRLFAAIIIVEIGAALVYRLAGVGEAPPETRFWFTLVWTLVTLAVVLTGLRRIRLTRLGRPLLNRRRPENPVGGQP